MRGNIGHKLAGALALLCGLSILSAQSSLTISKPDGAAHFQPLETATVAGARGRTIVIRDAKGFAYRKLPGSQHVTFEIGGALGTQRAEDVDARGTVLGHVTFQVDAETDLSDAGGRFRQLFQAAKTTMFAENRDGVGQLAWRGRTYRYFAPWILDDSNVMQGMQYFSPYSRDMVDLFAQAQRQDGLIWSFAFPDPHPWHQYHYWAYKDAGYARSEDGVLFARQPVENHNESNFVDALYSAWKSSGDNHWMTQYLANAEAALTYSITDPARWSPEFQLLKRGYTIDSWDFQPQDKYLVPFRMGAAQQIDPHRTKFVIFFGDNTAYAHACDELAEMLDSAGRTGDAQTLRARAQGIRARLDALAWNGRFYTHHVEIDPAVRRDFGGAPENEQLAMSNMYSLNRGIVEEHVQRILETYQNLREHLPPRSPGEWYAVYPPYARGFEKESPRWQYMNGGVHGHAAAQLALGAFEHGAEPYGADVLKRLGDLARDNGGKLFFAYTGAWDPPPPPARFETVALGDAANMNLTGDSEARFQSWMGHTDGNDMRGLPRGEQHFAGVPFQVDRAAGISGVSHGFPASVAIALDRKARALYLLHAADGVAEDEVAAELRLEYADGSNWSTYLTRGKQLASTWFPALASQNAGVAWRGSNALCGDVGVSWAAIENPYPDKAIARVRFVAPAGHGTYALLGLSLGDRMPFAEAPPISFGGPDNWTGALVMQALLRGLAGIRDNATGYDSVDVAPRWAAAGVSEASVTARYAGFGGYVTYCFARQQTAHSISLAITGNAAKCILRLLLPPGTASGKLRATVNGAPQPLQLEPVGASQYAVIETDIRQPRSVLIVY